MLVCENQSPPDLPNERRPEILCSRGQQMVRLWKVPSFLVSSKQFPQFAARLADNADAREAIICLVGQFVCRNQRRQP